MAQYRNIVVLTGAGVSAESGIQTFRASDGLWHEHRVEEVATPEAFARQPQLVQQFYNERRRQLLSADIAPNAAHHALAQLRPTTKDGLAEVTGLGPIKVAQYGDDLLRLIAEPV